MSIAVEIMLRGNEQVFCEQVVPPSAEPSAWDEHDVAQILTSILLAIDRVQNPGRTDPPPVGFRGMNWIVSSYQSGVVIALEIHSASAVAGPMRIDGGTLEKLIASAVSGAASSPVVH